MTRRACLDKLAAASREEVSDVEPTDVDETLTELDDAFAVRGAMAELPGECQEVLDRFFCRDESYRTIGEELDLPAGTIASRISRCLAKLREQLEGRKSGAGAS